MKKAVAIPDRPRLAYFEDFPIHSRFFVLIHNSLKKLLTESIPCKASFLLISCFSPILLLLSLRESLNLSDA